MHPEERKHRLEEQALMEKERIKEAIHMDTRERVYHQVESNSHTRNDKNKKSYYSNPFDNIPLSGNDGNNTPPRTPRVKVGACPSPPRNSQSHHESETNDEITSEDLMRF